jgi:hypothetical protein
MQDELWQQWRSFAALWAPGAPGAPLGTRAASAGETGSGFAPFIEAAERFRSATQRFIAAAASGSAPAAAEAAQGFSDYLRDQFADIHLPWSGLTGSPEATHSPSFTDWPALGPMREHQQRWQRMADAGRRFDEAQRRLQRLWSDALHQAATDFAARLQAPLPNAADPAVLRKLYDSWIDCAEDAYARTAHSEAFCSAQADLVNATSQWRQELRAGIEHWSKLLDLPTRSEINTLAQRLKTLEAQWRAAAPAARAPWSKLKARSAAPRAATKARARRTRRKARGKAKR